MMSKPIVIAMVLVSVYLFSAESEIVVVQTLSDQVDEILRNRIEAAGVPPKITIGDELIHASVVLPRFYEQRAYKPAWSDDKGSLPRVDALIKATREADREGLRPGDYHLARIETTLAEICQNQEDQKPLNPRRLVDLDLLLTDAFLIYASHLLAGRINPETIDPEWRANRREADLAKVLQDAIDSNRIEEALQNLLPPQPGYARLRQTLALYREIAAKGGWASVPDGLNMQKGTRGERVVALRNRLLVEGFIDKELNSDENLFDDALEQAVRQFQRRHGLTVDGVVGPATLAALNVPAKERVRQIEVNLERWRWLPQELGQHYIFVNIANFELDVIANSQPLMTMRIVVGKKYRRTPVFSDQMTYLVLNPSWNIPPKIAVQDKLPLIRQDPNYLTREKIRVFQGWGAEAKEINPKIIDWTKVTAQNFNYRLRQDPGPDNALGRVKFMFPNKFNVYIHDTPSRELFAKTVRTFSSGCIRIEKPLELAEYLLRGNPKWTLENILTAIDKHLEQTVKLPESIPVHLLYWTAWTDEDGTIHFRNDIYERDKRLFTALRE